MSTINSKNVQVGTSGVAAQNFTLYQPATPDGTVRLGVGNSGATTGDVVTVNSAGVTVTGTLTATTLSGSLGAATATSLTVNGNNISAVNSLGFRNRIINGDQRIDQRNAGASISITTGVFGVDRWYLQSNVGSGHTAQRSTTAPAGFKNSQLITIGTGATPTGTNYFRIRQAIEGFNCADLNWGTADAQSITVSFWVRSSVTGTYGLAVMNDAGNRNYVASYTVSAANTLEYKTVTIPGDTSGTWLSDNSAGIYLGFDLGEGPDRSRAAGSWGVPTSAGFGLTSGTKLVATSGATFYITGVQLEAGTVASPFERRDYGRELAMCQRYGLRVEQQQNTGAVCTSSTQTNTRFTFPVTMRATPTASLTTAGSWIVGNDYSANYTASSASISAQQLTASGGRVQISGFGTFGSNFFVAGSDTAGTAVMFMSAEL